MIQQIAADINNNILDAKLTLRCNITYKNVIRQKVCNWNIKLGP